MNAAKTLVWVMAGMLVALLGVLVVGLSLGWHKEDESIEPAPLMAGERAFNTLDLRQPSGTEVSQVTELGNWMAVTLTGGGVPDRVVLIDPRTGEIVGEIAVNASGAFPSSP